ncbi:MAG: peptidylprolyl isomerase [bacterium]
MRKSRLIGVAAAIFCTVGLAGCKKSPEQPGAGPKTKGKTPSRQAVPKLSPEERAVVLAEVNGEKITKGDFHDRIHRQSVFNRRRYTKLDRKKQYLEREFVMPVLEFASAQQQGLQKDPYVSRTLKNLMVSKLMRQLRTEFKTAEPADAELKAFFEKHQDDYNQPELVRVSHILVKDKATADKVATEAKGKSRVEFRRMVQTHSIDEATKARAGDLRYFDQQGNVRGLAQGAMATVPKPIVDAAWPLKKPGTVVGPIKTKLGFHVVYFTGRRPARKRTYGQAMLHVKKRVMRDKWQEKKQEFIKKLKVQFQTNLPEDKELKRRLGLVKIDMTTPAPQHGDHGRERMAPRGHGLGHGNDPHGRQR